MSWQVVKQPDQLYAIWSTEVDDFVAYDGTREEVIEFFVERSVEAGKFSANLLMDKIEADERPYEQFTETWESLNKIREWRHGSANV